MQAPRIARVAAALLAVLWLTLPSDASSQEAIAATPIATQIAVTPVVQAEAPVARAAGDGTMAEAPPAVPPAAPGVMPEQPVIRPAPNVDLSEVVEPSDSATAIASEESTAPAVAAVSAEAEVDNAGATPLVLLDSEVLPGTSTRLSWSPKVSFMGVSAPTPVLVVNGVRPGPTLCLTAAVHGDETNGIETVRRVLYDIDPEKLAGAVIGVPIVNLESFRAGSRYLPDRRDLNRFFPGNATGSAASRIAHSFFSEIIRHCDQLIDLHTGSFGRTNLQQVRADLRAPGVRALAEKMGRIVVVQSVGARGTLRRAATDTGIPTVTLEAGAPNILDRQVVDESVASVENAMRGLGLLDQRRFLRRRDAPVFFRSVWIRASEGGFLISETKLGAMVDEGALLGVVTNPITNQRSEIRSPREGRVIGMALNQVMQPGYAAYHLGIERQVDPGAADGPGVDESSPANSAERGEDLDALEGSAGADGELEADADGDDDVESGR